MSRTIGLRVSQTISNHNAAASIVTAASIRRVSRLVLLQDMALALGDIL
jgi:hypothetical protein